MESSTHKNIVLCADGTGNRGGYTPDSNVYKIYNAVDLHNKDVEQIIFYDNGVGTQTNKYIRSVCGAFGFGFKTNVQDLYEFLARNYCEGDRIYMFGFSRGAATIRAFNGFIHSCGLVKGHDKSNSELKEIVSKAMKAYVRPHKKDKIMKGVEMHPLPDIEFIGVWDTVAALGFPQRKDIAGFGMSLAHRIFRIVGSLYDKIDPYTFYNYELTPNVKRAFHALALDDERTSFQPMVWKENSDVVKKENEKRTANGKAPMTIEQVWFAGMHSNIGGGYERAGLANVSFTWMLENLDGLILNEGMIKSAMAKANVHGRLYDSREGFAAFYRYHPRELQKLCDDAGTEVKIHESVMRRLKLRTANYVPTSLPPSFPIVDNQNTSAASPEIFEEHWQMFNKSIGKVITTRKWLYAIFIEITLGFIIYAFYLWTKKPPVKLDELDLSGAKKHIVDTLAYITPEFLDGLIYMGIVKYPWRGTVAILALFIFYLITNAARKRTVYFGECLRKLYINNGQPHSKYAKQNT